MRTRRERSYRVEFSNKQKTEIRKRANGCCEECGIALGHGEGEVDHIVPEWMRVATPRHERRKLTADDGRLLCPICHQTKSSSEAAIRKRVDRAAKRHKGLRKAARPFRGWRNFRGRAIWAKKS